MSLVQLESFVAVAEEGNIGRAAKRLHVTQPPLTRRIRGLEDELGVSLFLRTSKGVRLLPAGEVLLGHARKILALVEDAKSSVVLDPPAPPGNTASHQRPGINR